MRLADLQDGLVHRLHRLTGCKVKFSLDSGEEVKGTLMAVGSNFVEMQIDRHSMMDSDAQMKGRLMKKPASAAKRRENIKYVLKKRPHSKGRSLIFPVDRISYLEVVFGHCEQRGDQ
ncbi:hypothetical protein [Bhargavaea cecembensis]|uniref:hypothetical protein n=1 Tax=Bhargavaea cecembensis TaxID=394098 RepID=UPI0011789436|nr:hypothetical protein [Bhargavaea cecembensis]